MSEHQLPQANVLTDDGDVNASNGVISEPHTTGDASFASRTALHTSVNADSSSGDCSSGAVPRPVTSEAKTSSDDQKQLFIGNNPSNAYDSPHHHHRNRRRPLQDSPPDCGTVQVNSGVAHVAVASVPVPGNSPKELHSTELLEPHREPGFHTIRRTFRQVKKGPASQRKSRLITRKRTRHGALPRSLAAFTSNKDGSSDEDAVGNASSSGSGTEGGYAGSASSSDNVARGAEYSSGSSSESRFKRRRKQPAAVSYGGDLRRVMLQRKSDMTQPSSSEIADFSTTATSESESNSQNEDDSITSSNDSDSMDDQESLPSHWPRMPNQVTSKAKKMPSWHAQLKSDCSLIKGKAPILALDCDVMAHVLTFLDPPSSLEILTMPLSRDWVTRYTRQPDLWRVLCLLEPFKAQVDDEVDSDSENDGLPFSQDIILGTPGKYRLLYTAFVRCMRYLAKIKKDASSGRVDSTIDYSEVSRHHSIGGNKNLQEFLAHARSAVVRKSKESRFILDQSRKSGDASHIGVADDGSDSNSKNTPKKVEQDKKPKLAPSSITQRLLGPTRDGLPGQTELPWSCAIYSIVNWMVAFSDVEGIQIMCLKVLPPLLEDEQQRLVAQRASLTNFVLRAMVVFPNSEVLHASAFHTIVLLARPLGGREGMLFHTTMMQSSGIFSNTIGGEPTGRSGIAVLLDSTRRFQSSEVLQAMSCWSLVNIALAPAQKQALISLGGIKVTTNAMLCHPLSPEVQFRALFALINLVIPSTSLQPGSAEEATGDEPDSGATERAMLDCVVHEVVRLVVVAMKNFSRSGPVVNRACLVLHNLSLTESYHTVLLWAPNCYQMLEWCMGNYPGDEVLQQSAAGTLQRLQTTLSRDQHLRERFVASLKTQEQLSLEESHREAISMHQQQRAGT